MGLPLTSDSRRAQDLLTRLLAGLPLVPEGGAWPADDLLQLAGACLHLLSTCEAERRGVDGAAVHPQYGEAAVDALFDDLLAAVEWAGHCTRMVAEGQ